jgi:hypothetical protein
MNDDERGIRVTVEDLKTGEKQTRDVPPGDYMLLTTEPAHVAHINAFANGTHVVTIKGRTRR